MAFAIITTDTRYIWHINEKKPVEMKGKILLFQADGHELDHIMNMFSNIPTRPCICRWHGDMAHFIYDNL